MLEILVYKNLINDFILKKLKKLKEYYQVCMNQVTLQYNIQLY